MTDRVRSVSGCHDCPFFHDASVSTGAYCGESARTLEGEQGPPMPSWCPLEVGGPITVAHSLHIARAQGEG